MRVIERRIDYASRSDTFKLIITSCWHLGNRHCREDAIRKLTKEITNNDKTYFIALGDMAEYISLADIKRRDFSEMAMWLFDNGGEGLSDIARTENIILSSYLKGLGNKCVALAEGNHEVSIRQYSEHNAYAAQIEMLADGQNDHRADHRAIVLLRFKRGEGTTWTYPIHITHGSGNGSSNGAMNNKLRQIIAEFDGISLHCFGHWHRYGHEVEKRFRPGQVQCDKGRIDAIGVPSLVEDMRYSENRDKEPLVMGYWEVYITPDKERVELNFKEVT